MAITRNRRRLLVATAAIVVLIGAVSGGVWWQSRPNLDSRLFGSWSNAGDRWTFNSDGTGTDGRRRFCWSFDGANLNFRPSGMIGAVLFTTAFRPIEKFTGRFTYEPKQIEVIEITPEFLQTKDRKGQVLTWPRIVD